jgi:hypothetical protein
LSARGEAIREFRVVHNARAGRHRGDLTEQLTRLDAIAWRLISRTSKESILDRPTTTAISPFFIVSDVDQTIVIYRSQMSAIDGFPPFPRTPITLAIRSLLIAASR